MPSIEALVRRCRALAMLDAVLSPEWEFRFYSFNAGWAPGEMMASMRNGAGDEWFILFTGDGAAMKGFDHESAMSPWTSGVGKPWPGLYERVPAAFFSSFLREPAFSMDNATFCIWRCEGDSAAWETGVRDFPVGDDPDGSGWMLEILGTGPDRYQQFAREYYQVDLPLEAIERVYNLEPMTRELAATLNDSISLDDLVPDITEIGYPVPGDAGMSEWSPGTS